MEFLDSAIGCAALSGSIILLTLALMFWDNASTDTRQKKWTQ